MVNGAVHAHDLPAVGPYDEELEAALIGAVLADPDVLPRVRAIVQPADFFREHHRWLYAAALAVADADTVVEPMTVGAELGRRGQLAAVGGYPRLTMLTTELVTAIGADYWAVTIAGHARNRRILGVSAKLAAAANAGTDDPDRLLQAALVELDALRVGPAPRPAGPTLTVIAADALQHEVFADLRFAVPGLLQEGLTILAGAPKLGKSRLMLAMAVAIASGGKALGTIDVEQGDVLYLALEDGRRRIQRRIAQLLEPGVNFPHALHIGEDCPRLDDGGVEAIAAWLDAHPHTRLVIIDTFKRVRPRERAGVSTYGQDYDALAPLQTLAQERGVAIVVVHHTRKQGAEDPLDLISGSTGLTGSADAALVLRRARGSADATLTVVGRDLDDADVALRSDEHVGWVLLGDAADYQRSAARAAILAVLHEAGEPLTAKAISLRLPASSYNNVRQRLWKMGQAGEVSVIAGHYRPSKPDNSDNSGNTDTSDNTDNSGDPVIAVIGRARAPITESAPDAAVPDAAVGVNGPQNGAAQEPLLSLLSLLPLSTDLVPAAGWRGPCMVPDCHGPVAAVSRDGRVQVCRYHLEGGEA
jgi:hypothetical protein